MIPQRVLAACLCLMLGTFASFAAEQPVVAESPAAAAASATFEIRMPGAAAAITADPRWLATLPHQQVTAAAHEETPSVWDGVALADVLRKAGAPLDKSLRGSELAKFVRITASDGYQVVFSLAELDAGFANATVLVVDQQNGKPIGAKDGPFRLVVPGDKRAGRWARNLRTVELMDASSLPGDRGR